MAQTSDAADPAFWRAGAISTTIVMLVVLAGLHWRAAAPPLLMFWGVFWPCILVAIFALWAALYRPAAPRQP